MRCVARCWRSRVPTGVITISTMVPLSTAHAGRRRGGVDERRPAVAAGHQVPRRQRAEVRRECRRPLISARSRDIADRRAVGVSRRDRDQALRRAILRQDVRRDRDRDRRRRTPTGPDSGGVSWFFIVQRAAERSAAATAAMRHLVLRCHDCIHHCRSWSATAHFWSAKLPKSTLMRAVAQTSRPVWSCP